MPFIPVANVAQVRVQQLLDSQQVENVYHVHTSVPWDNTTLTVLGEYFRNWWATYIAGIVPPQLSLQRIILTDLTDQPGPQVEYTHDMPQAGEGELTALPNNVTVAVKWTTGQSGRSFRGRTYHLCLSEQVVSANAITPTYQDQLLDAYTHLVEDLSDDEPTQYLAVVSLYSGTDADGKPIPRTFGVQSRITNVGVEPTVDSQRRRLPGRGR